jgi:foldase protein PrsA
VLRQDTENTLLRRKLNDEMAKSVASTAEQVHAQHILVPDETAANAVLERLKNGESFEALAAELSIDTSNKDTGGDLGWFAHGTMVSEFEDAAFKLQPGETSGPVKTQFGVHIIRVIERDANRPLDPQQLDAAKSGALQKWLDDEKKNHKIERLLDAAKVDWVNRHGPKALAGM